MAYVALAAAWMLPAGAAMAGKPSGGGGGGSTGDGTIYFLVGSAVQTMWSMASDGSAKTQLPAGVSGDPSSMLHGGHRWFLRPLATSGTNPDGTAHTEMFALRDDGGASVQLTSAASLEFARCSANPYWTTIGGSARWAKDDSFVSVAAVDWTGGASAPTSALFVVSLAFDGGGTPAASTGPVAVPGVATNYADGGYIRQPAIDQHDWSPDGASVAWTERDSRAGGTCTARVTSVGSGAGRTVATGRVVSSWSSTGTLLLWASDYSVIESVAAAGGTRTTLVALVKHHELNGNVVDNLWSAAWSPTGSHFVYVGQDNNYNVQNVLRVTSSGAGTTNLTNTTGIDDGAYQAVWR